jgi:hypothetical protein
VSLVVGWDARLDGPVRRDPGGHPGVGRRQHLRALETS